MTTNKKVTIGLSIFFLLLIIWAFRSKNETVEAVMFPYKKILGLSEPDSPLDGENAQKAYGKLADKILYNPQYPTVTGLGLNGKLWGKNVLQVSLVKGKDHSSVYDLFPDNKFDGLPVEFIEKEIPVKKNIVSSKNFSEVKFSEN